MLDLSPRSGTATRRVSVILPLWLLAVAIATAVFGQNAGMDPPPGPAPQEIPVFLVPITVTAEPSFGGTTTGTGSYPRGSPQPIAAVANPGFVFAQWDDGTTNNPRTVTVDFNWQMTTLTAPDGTPLTLPVWSNPAYTANFVVDPSVRGFYKLGAALLDSWNSSESISVQTGATVSGSFRYLAGADGPLTVVAGLVNGSNQWVGSDPQVIYAGTPSPTGEIGVVTWPGLTVPAEIGTHTLWYEACPSADANDCLAQFQSNPPTVAGPLAGTVATVNVVPPPPTGGVIAVEFPWRVPTNFLPVQGGGSNGGIYWQDGELVLYAFAEDEGDGSNEVIYRGICLTGESVSLPLTATNWLGSYVDLGGGWKTSGWLGCYADLGRDWIGHPQHGPLYVDPQSTSNDVYLYAMDFQWLWTGSALYPFVYRLADASWLWYLKDSANPRWFYNFRTHLWENQP